MPRLRLIIALAAIGALLTLLNHSCSARFGPLLTAPTPESQPAPLGSEDRHTAELPIPAKSLIDAEWTARQFITLCLTRQPDASTARLRRFATTAFATELHRTTTCAATTRSTAELTHLKIRFLAAQSVQYEITAQHTSTAPGRTQQGQNKYAITLVREDSAWKVDGLQPADAGNSGDTPP